MYRYDALPNNPAITFDKVGFSYDGIMQALTNVSFTIEYGSFTCILGSNGSGKSTCAKLIAALLVPHEGDVIIGNFSTTAHEALYTIRRTVGLVMQNPDDQMVASIVENEVAFGPENIGVDPSELHTRVNHALADVGLSGFEKREIHTLSGGQKQRVAIAGALAMQPRILVLDEASAMLDPHGRKQVLETCLRIKEQGTTVVMITHCMDDAVYADRVIVLDSGHIAYDGSPATVLVQADKMRALKLDVPFSVELSHQLSKRGIYTTPTVFDHVLQDQLCHLYSTR